MSDSEMGEISQGTPQQQVAPLTAEEVHALRSVLVNFEGIKTQLGKVSSDQVGITSAMSDYALKSDEQHLASAKLLRENQLLLQKLVAQTQTVTQQIHAELSKINARINVITAEIQQMKSETSLAVENINTLKDTVNKMEPGTLVFDSDDLYPDWDVTGPAPDHFDQYEVAVLERLVDKCLKQKETPIYGSEDNEDIKVYALNMIMWYGAYGLHFTHPQVNARVGQLLMNHTKGKAKHWLLRDYKGPRTWTAMIKGMRGRFVTKAKEEDLVASFFDCKQGTKSLDSYIEEIIRLGKTDNVSEHYKMILFKKGLKSTKLRKLLQVREFDTLEDLLDGARGLNPKDSDSDTTKMASKPAKKAPSTPTEPKARGRGGQRCTSTRCSETGHTADQCWALHPELEPKWLQNRERSSYNTAVASGVPDTSGTEQKLWDVLASIQSDLSKIKADLN
ncbi:hypothetical protein PF008_g13288 [Phytophthora fragariae]|uniref:Retrotransposon gag domain-containing protein n=1 Tax=Phytophthora fragariae TaxID=53985 RepID=A0A6G0RKB4_9STRA|nr:hypothetical protein PF008_g13288 [Phytophthora fragariae]